MNPIKQLAAVSAYRPKKGAKLELFHLVTDEGISRDEAKRRFEECNGYSQFRTVYKKLKDDLLDGVLEHNFPNLPKDKKVKFGIWKKHIQSKMLIASHKDGIGIKMAIETIKTATKYGELEVVKSLCKDLVKYYSLIAPNTTQYRKYLNRLKDVNKKLFLESELETIYSELVLSHQKNWSIKNIEADIKIIISEKPKSDYFRYRYFYYSIIGLYFQMKNQTDGVKENARNAEFFFSNCKEEITYFPRYQFLAQLIPIYINNQEFALAQNNIKQCLKLTPIGVPNWHISLLDEAILGFYSNKIPIVNLAFQTAKNNTKKLNSDRIKERWLFIKGYLTFFNKIGRTNASYDFKLYRFLNSFEDRQKDIPQKINLLILELIHLLANCDKKAFMAKSEQLEHFITRNLRSTIYIRTKYFLRLLKCVEKGDYHPVRVAAHAKRSLASLKGAKPVQTALRFDFEIVPYEILWEEVLKILR